jgi:hypothetical protein
MSFVRRPWGGHLRLAASLVLGLILAAGCGEDKTERRVALPVRGVAYNDTVGPSDTLFLKVQFDYTTDCERSASFEVQSVATNVYAVAPVARVRADQTCTALAGTDVALLKVLALSDTSRVNITFLVRGPNGTLTANVITGRAPVDTLAIRFSVQVEDKDTGARIPGALVEIRDVETNSILAQGAADTAGVFRYAHPCGLPLQYVVHATANARNATLIFRDPPARCRKPEVVVIRV